MRMLLLTLTCTVAMYAMEPVNLILPSKLHYLHNKVDPVCLSGYLYYMVIHPRGAALTQAFKKYPRYEDKNPQPITCKYRGQ